MNDENVENASPEISSSEAPETTAPSPAAPALAAAPETPPPADGSVDIKEIEAGKTFAILSYVLSFVSLPFFIVPLIQRDNTFALFHAKQVMMLWLAGIALSVASGILTLICIGPFVAILGAIGLLVLAIIGLIGCTKNEMKPLPVIGKWAEDWFKGIAKKA